MPKKQKRTEEETHSLIVRDSKIRHGCSEFQPDFTLREIRDTVANWDLGEAHNVHEWPPGCTQAFKEAVARMRRKFDIARPWPP